MAKTKKQVAEEHVEERVVEEQKVQPEEQSPPPIHRKECKELLKHTFTPSERAEIADAMARGVQERDAAQNTLKTATANLKAAVASAEARVTEEAARLNTGWELRQTKCEKVFDYGSATVRLVRLDTYETVWERSLSDEERQTEFPKQAMAPEADAAAPSVEKTCDNCLHGHDAELCKLPDDAECSFRSKWEPVKAKVA